jgi:DNA-directed RNA polymerase specialized sigma24 family protein
MLRRKTIRDSIHGETDALLEQIASVDSKPDERLALEGGIRLLTPEQREVVHLHVFDGLTFREIAESSGRRSTLWRRDTGTRWQSCESYSMV